MNTINPYGKAGGIRNQTSTPKPAAEKSDSPARTTQQGDSVSLSQTAEQLSQIQSRLDETPAIDRAKVEAIKTAIARGEYRVDAEKIADQLIALEKERLA